MAVLIFASMLRNDTFYNVLNITPSLWTSCASSSASSFNAVTFPAGAATVNTLLFRSKWNRTNGLVDLYYKSTGDRPMRKTGKNYSADEKVAILQRPLIDRISVADLCYWKWASNSANSFLQLTNSILREWCRCPATKKQWSSGCTPKYHRFPSGKTSTKKRSRFRTSWSASRTKKELGEPWKDPRLPPQFRDEVVRFVTYWADRTETPVLKIITSLNLNIKEYYAWSNRLGHAIRHNCQAPKDGCLLPAEKSAIVAFHDQNLTEGYRLWKKNLIEHSKNCLLTWILGSP